jgi:hypothetical protein
MRGSFLFATGFLFLTSFCLANSHDPLIESVCFNDQDEAATGMTRIDYYESINSSCDEQVKIYQVTTPSL